MTTFSLFNDIKRIVRSSRLETESVTTIFGDVKLDLTQAPLEPGEHTMRVMTVFGDVKLRLPEHIGVQIDAMTVFSGVEVETVSRNEEEKPGGNWVSENFERAPIRINLTIQGVFGDVDVVRLPVMPKAQTPQLSDTSTIQLDRPNGYEGETRSLERERH